MAMITVSSSIMRGEPKTAALTSPFLLDVANAPILVFLLNILMTAFLSIMTPLSIPGGLDAETVF
jgi:hypothetical protein